MGCCGCYKGPARDVGTDLAGIELQIARLSDDRGNSHPGKASAAILEQYRKSEMNGISE